MDNFKYHAKAAEFDQHLEQVMESHAATTKTDPTEPEAAVKQSGLQSYVDGVTIHDEIQSILSRPKTASEEIRAELAREQMSDIIEGRRTKFASFLAETSALVEKLSERDIVAETTDLIRQGMDPAEAARKTLA